ncbi:unnamed protein product, partial [Medioppia subpectinata]
NKKVRNQLGGYVTHLYNRIQNGVVKGIHIKAHEEEKEKNESFIPKVGVLDVEKIIVDSVTYGMIEHYNIEGDSGQLDVNIHILSNFKD